MGVNLNFVIFFAAVVFVNCGNDFDFNLPAQHVKYFLFRRPDIAEKCRADKNCPYNLMAQNLDECWGYEPNCNFGKRSYSRKTIKCSKKAPDIEKSRNAFYYNADFGLIKKHNASLVELCSPVNLGDASLRCSESFEYCYAKNIFFNFANLKHDKNGKKYRSDIIGKGDVGGRCKFHERKFKNLALDAYDGYLQSWAAEMKYFQRFPSFQLNDSYCDIIFDQPTIVIKLDAGINMYHHFCDFINLYLSQHLNGSFHQDVDIILWDTDASPYFDIFRETWLAFTTKPLIDLQDFDGKRVCFREVMFPVLARKVFGLYYNMPMPDYCRASGLVQAFSHHLIHRLQLKQNGPLREKLRVTYLVRSSQYRIIMNTNEIVKRLKADPQFSVTVAKYTLDIPVLEQYQMSHNTDIFMSIHGAGLTHMFFLPDWAVVFELYHCGDPECYRDLATLRGLKFFGWEDETKVQYQEKDVKNPKFTNFYLDADEVMRIVHLAAETLWENFWKSLESKPKTIIGKDHFGNIYYVHDHTDRTIKRGYIPADRNNWNNIPVEWRAWLTGRRTDPPTELEVLSNIKRTNETVQRFSRNETQDVKLDSEKKMHIASGKRPYPKLKDLEQNIQSRKCIPGYENKR
ncbi:EGF domain-specific O-linked N-acetylglucosamine transferase [Trichinella britovi]|uniref:EGF domain-specific O-linked N-acetylglucosamine transferase n=1 Tax=Trichinella britovi TaxID=45882 RepID=A0A0V1CEL0_TRIBR|nr:EGF domain-specific O-linked N-acetylglucosamine transferase [Trichinella britovi]